MQLLSCFRGFQQCAEWMESPSRGLLIMPVGVSVGWEGDRAQAWTELRVRWKRGLRVPLRIWMCWQEQWARCEQNKLAPMRPRREEGGGGGQDLPGFGHKKCALYSHKSMCGVSTQFWTWLCKLILRLHYTTLNAVWAFSQPLIHCLYIFICGHEQ